MPRLKVMKLFFQPPEMFMREYESIASRVEKIYLYHSLSFLPDRSMHIVEIFWDGVEDVEGLMDEVPYFKTLAPLIDKEVDAKSKGQLYMMEVTHPPLIYELLEAMFREFKCFFDYPFMLEKKGSSVKIVGTPEGLKRIKEMLDEEPEANMKVLSITDYHPPGKGVLEELTTQQYEAIELAVRHGYYDIPRKMDLRKLCQGMGINHSTFSAHIRKGEKSIMENLFSDEEGA
ncbi:MAG: helix-turn-helix domain-containing protein [Candidatus Thermoplasmatota archaeon]|nr:helix-turn-helix domain-containing protein [Candidatus Thermoplasmatota archaeon]